MLTYKQTTFRAIPAQTEHSSWTCSPLRMRYSGSLNGLLQISNINTESW